MSTFIQGKHSSNKNDIECRRATIYLGTAYSQSGELDFAPAAPVWKKYLIFCLQTKCAQIAE